MQLWAFLLLKNFIQDLYLQASSKEGEAQVGNPHMEEVLPAGGGAFVPNLIAT